MGLITDNNETYYTGSEYGGYRYIPLNDIVNNFMFSYVGEGKIISKANRRDVLFHAKRAMQEFSYDVSKVEKIQEVDVPSTLSIPMPQDYISYVSICYVDSSGIEHPIPRGRVTSSPSESIVQDDQGNYTFDGSGNLVTGVSETVTRFNSLDANSLANSQMNDDYFNNSEFLAEKLSGLGGRYGAEPELANRNGLFVIDEANGKINFSSNLINKTITIKYISDSLGNDDEMRVHKFAEEAIYKSVAYSILSSMSNVPEYIVNRFRRERRASMRQAKLRLYDLKLSDMTNAMRGKSKIIKH
jgi:hypothetical protein